MKLSFFVYFQGVMLIDVTLINTSFSTKTWLRNTNFNNSLNWDVGLVPCTQDNVIFPEEMRFAVQLPDGETTLRELVLPLDGLLLLPVNGKLEMFNSNGGKTSKDSKCSSQSTVKFTRWNSLLWTDPENWSGHNKATPDLEAIPCSTDSVVFPERSTFSVLMPDTIIRVAELTIGGKSIENSGWIELMSTRDGQMQFSTVSDEIPDVLITSEPCSDVTGCECQNEFIKDDVCSSIRCKNVQCLDPIMPYGNCCPICGASLILTYNKDFTMSKLEKYLQQKISTEFDYHISKVHNKIQIVIVTKSEYKEKVQDIAIEVQEELSKSSSYGLQPKELLVSGALVSPASFTRQITFFIGFMFTALFITIVIFYIYTDTCSINAQDGRQYVFAVFENQSEEVELFGSKREAKKPMLQQAFNNPMYGSTNQVAKLEDQDGMEDCPIYSILDDVKSDKEYIAEEVAPVDDLLETTN